MPERRELPPTLKNQVFEMIQSAGLDIREFRWDVVKGEWAHHNVSRLIHPRTGFFFIFDVGDDYHPKVWPGVQYKGMPATSMMQVAKLWVSNIAPEIKAPDLWQLAADQARLHTDPLEQNTPFTQQEQLQIGAGLTQLEEFVYSAEPSLSVERKQAVAARFGYLRSGVARLGRVDWATLVLGQLFALAAERIITVQTFNSLYNLAGTLFGNLLSIGSGVASRLLGG